MSPVHYLFQRGVIFSTEVAREAVLIVSMPGVAGLTKTPFSTTCIALALRLERGSFFLALIHAYIPWLNFVVILTRGKYLLKTLVKKKKKIVTSK